MAFRKKARAILELSPDIVVVPECESLDKLKFDSQIAQPQCQLWFGDNPNKGLGVFSYSKLRLGLHGLYDPSIKYVVPITVEDTNNIFTLFAVWTMNDKSDPTKRYIGCVWQAVNRYAHLLNGSSPILIAGDFNWNVTWDSSSNLSGNLSQVIGFLSQRRIRSLYHGTFGEEFGEESQPTLYMYREESRPYHIDYIFASEKFFQRLQSFNIGKYKDWIEHSDHMPLVADFL